MFCLHVCLCTTCMPGTHRGQRRVSYPVEREWVLGIEPGPLKEQPVLFTAEPSFQSQYILKVRYISKSVFQDSNNHWGKEAALSESRWKALLTTSSH